MNELKIRKHREINGNVGLEFEDNSYLLLVPYRNYGNIEGFDSAVLYQNGVLAALATQRSSRYSKPEESGFWSRGSISQQQLAQYLTAAIELGKRVSDERIDVNKETDCNDWSDFWEFWKITIESNTLNYS